MVDKPGCTTLEQLNELKKSVKKTGKIWSVNFSERFHVSAVTKAEELINDGLIGVVKQTIGTGPHRQGNYERPKWFYERARGQYATKLLAFPTPARRATFEAENPRKQMFTKTDMAKYENT